MIARQLDASRLSPARTMQRMPMWHVAEFTSCAIRAAGR
jgi:hypothetical protein